MKTTTLLSVIVLSIALLSCTKEGPEGPQGPAGKDGTNGTNGTNGNANVISSNTVTINNWTLVWNDGINYEYSATIDWPSITQDIRDRGVVLAYVQDGTNWVALPYTWADDTYAIYVYNYWFNTGTVTIQAIGYDNDGSLDASDFNGDVFRIVAIPASNLVAHPNVDLKNYNEVVKTFNVVNF